MQAAVDRLLEACRPGRPGRAGRLSIVPLTTPLSTGPSLRPLGQVPTEAALRLSELDGQARVEEVQVYNGTAEALFTLEGELLAGGFQDRIVCSSSLVHERSAAILATACSEEGRFEGEDVRMRPSGLVASPRFRRSLRVGLYEGGPAPEAPSQRQEAVWDEIEADRKMLDLEGNGISMLRLRQSTDLRCANLIGGVVRRRGECGWLVFLDRRFVALDLFFCSGLAAAYRTALLQAAAYDCLMEALRNGPVEAGDPGGDLPGLARFWEEMTVELREAVVVREETCAGSIHLRAESPALAGTLLLDKDRPVHLSLFPAVYADDLAAMA